jgi:hypothetical protein
MAHSVIERQADGSPVLADEKSAVGASESAARWTRRDTWVAAVLMLAAGATYVRTLAPGVVAGNSGEYQYVAAILGIPHSTGYPLYTLLSKAFTLLPIGSVAYRVNLLSAAAAALAVAAVYALVLRLTGRRLLSGAMALGFAFAANFWSAALIAEVHTLNVAFIALDAVLLLRWGSRQRALPRPVVAWSELRAFALVYGLSLAHHRMSMLLLPAFAAYIALTLTGPRPTGMPDEPAGPNRPGGRQELRTEAGKPWLGPLAWTVLLCLLPLVLYAYIPIRGGQLLANSDPAVTAIYKDRVPEAILRGTVSAHYRGGWAGFVNLVSGSDYAVDVGIDSWAQLGDRIALWGQILIAQFSAVGIVLGLLGAAVLLRRNWRTGLLFVLGYCSLVGFALVYVGHGQIWYYFMPSYIFLVGCIGVAADAIWNLLDNRGTGRSKEPLIDSQFIYAALWFILPAALWMHNGSIVDMSRYDVDARRAQDVLSRPLESDAVLMGPWDLVTVIRYRQFAEGVRPDLVVVHGDPAYSSGQKIMTRAMELRRPFYLLAPVDASLAERTGEWVQVTPVPYYGSVDVAGPAREFGGKVALLGGRLSPDPVRLDRTNGGVVKVELYWRVLAPPKRDYKLFAHLIDPEGLTRVQVDESPASIYYPASRWQPGQVLLDSRWLALPPDAPLGKYNLEIGLADPDTGARLPIASDPSGVDAVTVGAIKVELRGNQ